MIAKKEGNTDKIKRLEQQAILRKRKYQEIAKQLREEKEVEIAKQRREEIIAKQRQEEIIAKQRREEEIAKQRQETYNSYLLVCPPVVQATTYCRIGSLARKPPDQLDLLGFIGLEEKFGEGSLDRLYPKREGFGQLHPPPHYLMTGARVPEWRGFSEQRQQW